MRYPVAVWNTNGVYSAEVPDLPGAITEADSIEELERSVKAVSYTHLTLPTSDLV